MVWPLGLNKAWDEAETLEAETNVTSLRASYGPNFGVKASFKILA